METCIEFEVAKLNLKPDDILLIKIPQALNPSAIKKLQDSVSEKIGAKCLIVHKNMDVLAISKGDVPTKAGD